MSLVEIDFPRSPSFFTNTPKMNAAFFFQREHFNHRSCQKLLKLGKVSVAMTALFKPAASSPRTM